MQKNWCCSKIDVVNITLYWGLINKDKEGKKSGMIKNWLSSKINAVSSDAISRFHCRSFVAQNVCLHQTTYIMCWKVDISKGGRGWGYFFSKADKGEWEVHFYKILTDVICERSHWNWNKICITFCAVLSPTFPSSVILNKASTLASVLSTSFCSL